MWHIEYTDTTVSFEDIVKVSLQLKRDPHPISLAVAVAGNIYIIRMADGLFSILSESLYSTTFATGDCKFYATDIPPNELTNIRPIWFLRESVQLSTSTRKQTSSPSVVCTALGFQANHNGRNIKRILYIYPDSEFVIGDK